MSPQEIKEQFIKELQAKIEGRFTGTNLNTRFSTCLHSNWNRDEYLYMPEVAKRLEAKGYTVTNEVNHGVTDWFISV